MTDVELPLAKGMSRPATRDAPSPRGLGRDSMSRQQRRRQESPHHFLMPDVHARGERRLQGGASFSSTTADGLGRRSPHGSGNSRGSTGGFRPATAPGSGSMPNLQLSKRRPITYQKKLGPYRDLGVDTELAETEMSHWAHEHEVDVNVEQCQADSLRSIAELRQQSGALTAMVRERTAVCAKLRDELGELDDRQAHIDTVKERWSAFTSQKKHRADALCVVKREYSNRANQNPVGGTDEAGKFWSVRVVDPGSRADPALAERVAYLEQGEEERLYDAAKVEVETKGYELMVKRENANLEAANEALLELQDRHRAADDDLGRSKAESIAAKRGAETAHQACVKFVVAQRERKLLRKNTLHSKKAELSRAQEETRRMQAAHKKLEDDVLRHEHDLKTGAMKMQVGVALNRAAVEGYDTRMGSKEEFEKFETLRRVTKGGFPADVVDTYLAVHAKRRRARELADDAGARLQAVEGRKREVDEALRERMAGTSAARNKEFNAEQDKLTDRLDDAKGVINDRRRRTTELARKVAAAAQGLGALMRKMSSETAEDRSAAAAAAAHDLAPSLELETAADVAIVLSNFDAVLTRTSLLEVAEEREASAGAEELVMYRNYLFPSIRPGGGARTVVGANSDDDSFSAVTSDSEDDA